MPFQKTILDGGLGCSFEAFGIVTARDYVSVMVDHLTNPNGEFEKLRYTIVRMEEAAPWHIEHFHMRYVGRLAQQAFLRNPLPVVAVVTPPDVDPAAFQLFAGTAGRNTWENAAFRDYEDAQIWLLRQLAEKFGLTGLSLSAVAPFSEPLEKIALPHQDHA